MLRGFRRDARSMNTIVDILYRPRGRFAANHVGSALLVRPAPIFDERSAEHGDLVSGHWFWGTLRNLWPIYGEVLLAAFLVNLVCPGDAACSP